MRLRGLDHVQLAMPAGGEDKAREFYAGILGLDEIEKPEALRARGGCWFRGGGIEFHLGVEQEFRPARKAHPALRVADYEAVRNALDGTPDENIPGVQRFFTEDPFGNRIEIGDYRPTGPCPNLLVPDLEAALPWYVVKLGFEEVKRMPGPPAGALLERDGMPLLIEETEGDIVPKSTHDPFGLDALYLIRDPQLLYADFRERGAVAGELPAEAGDFMLKTPEGYILVFSSSV